MTNRIIGILSSYQFSLDNEARLQLQVAAALTAGGVTFTREQVLSPRQRIDFFCYSSLTGESVGIEVKIKGQAKAIYKQCLGYCEGEKIKSLILLTNRSMGFPAEMHGKPCFVVKLGRSWL